jgi:ubiquinone/menaquinone biosynthesis C-methylase UbiE
VGFLSQRRRQVEWMDEEGADPGEIRKSLDFIERANRWLGYARATLWHLDRFSRSWSPGETITILDLATGSADIPRAILNWADRRRLDVRIVGIDRQGPTIDVARRRTADPRLQLVQADVFDLPFETASFDYVTTSMFLHHLSDEQAVAVMRTAARLSRRGVIVADLLRHYRAYVWISLLTLASSPMVRHDARASVAQAFTGGEILRLANHAGLDFVQYYRHFGHRFVLAGEKTRR